MIPLRPELAKLIEAGPLVHITTVGPDGSPQVSVTWIGLDGGQMVSGHMSRYQKLRNIERASSVVLSIGAPPRQPGASLSPHAVIRARAAVEPSDQAWDLLNQLAKVYIAPDAEFPAPKGPGYIVRYTIERFSGVGPWAS